MKFKILPP